MRLIQILKKESEWPSRVCTMLERSHIKNSVIPETFLQVNLTNGHLSPGQARSLLNQVADGSNLSSLKISENDLSSVPGITVAPFLL